MAFENLLRGNDVIAIYANGEARIAELYIRKHRRLLCSRRFSPANYQKRSNDYTNVGTWSSNGQTTAIHILFSREGYRDKVVSFAVATAE